MLSQDIRIKQVYVIDTTAVTDVRLREFFGVNNLNDVVVKLAPIYRDARLMAGVEIYMSSLALSEMKRFLVANGVDLANLRRLVEWIIPKPSSKHEIRLPASIIVVYVDSVRKNLMKGLRVAEEATRKAFQRGIEFCKEKPSQNEAGTALGEVMRWLREKYREATRRGIVDSVEDIDTILLAHELKAILITSDEGVRRFAEELGIPTQDPITFTQALIDAVNEVKRTGIHFSPNL
ncbi:MAG TPA: RNA ligase partner protein [Pyrodictium sp.]|nr:RNA ligase partner protein [Pyrodictium sp.]